MMTTHTQLSIIVPCYNEEQRIAHTISKLIPAVEKLDIAYEIILVNDGSIDDTHTIIKDMAHNNDNIKVLSYHINKGKGYAVKCGIKKSQGEYYLIMDADLATDISELKKFWSKRATADCLIGNRKNEHNKRNMIRDIAGGISHGLVNTVLNLKLKDTQCGFKLLSSKTKNMWSHVHSERRGFDFELLYLLQKNGYSIKEVDVKRNDVAGSKVTFSSYLTTWKELRNTSRLHNIKTLDRINQLAVSALAVMGIVFYGVVNVAQAQNETTTITECSSYNTLTYNGANIYPEQNELCGTAAGQVTDEFPVGGLCRTGTPFLQNITTTTQESAISFDPGSKVDGTISIIKKGLEDRIIIAGDFIGYDKETRNGIAVIDLNGNLIKEFDPLAGFNGKITDIIPQSNGQIIVRGDFTEYNKESRDGIARLNADGSLDKDFDPARYLNGVITAVNVDSEGFVFIGGKFTEYNKETANTLIKLNRDGSIDKDFNVGLGAAGFISSIAFGTNQSIFIGGDFDTFNKLFKIDLVKLNKDGSVDTSFEAKILPKYMSSVTYVLITDKGQAIVAGSLGETDEKGNTAIQQSSIVQLDPNGKEDTSFAVIKTNSKSTISFMTFQGSDVIFLGDFTDLNDKIVRRGVARVDAAGTILDFDPSSYSDGTIKSLSVQNPEKILIAGEFTRYDDKEGGKQRYTAARIERDAMLEADIINTTVLIDEYTWSCIDVVSNSNGSATSYNSNGSATSYNSNGSATSYNSNGSATSYNSNGSATSYNSNGSATSYNSNGSATSYNSNGSATSYNSNGSATSYNSNGSATSYNSNVGRCGSASGGYFTTMPMNNLCDTTTNNTTVTVRDSLGQDGMYNWSCGIDHYTYTSTACSAYRTADGVCGSAAGGITSTFPAENLCASGTPYLQQVTSGSITLYTWSCIGMGTGAYISSCTAYQTPTTDACIPYGQSGTTQYNINNVILPGTNVALMLNYDYDEGDFANVAMSAVQTTGATLASAANVDYTDASTHTLNGIINSSMSLQVSFTNLNTQGTKTGQFIQYRQPADISARTVRSSLRNRISGQAVLEQETIVGSNWYGCNPGGWRTSLAGLVPSQILNQVSAGNITNNNGGSVFGRFSSTGPTGNDSTDDNDSITWLNPQQGDLSYQNEDGERVVFIAQLPGWINVNDEAERFLYWDQPNKGFKVECEICATSTPVTTQTGACVDLPDHAIPNIATGIIQYTGANGWFPSTTYTYNPVTSTTDCTFVCENNYSRVDGECKPNTMISSCIGGMPQYAVLTVPGANTYTSTWNGSGWTPPIRTYTYNPTVYNDPALDACNYKCPTNYTWNGGACIANNNTATCNGTLPNNASWTNGNTFTQTRNGSNWVPAAITGTFSTGSITCGFTCNNGYSRSDTTQTCVQNNTLTYGRWTGDWSACTTTGNTATGGANTYTWDIGTWGPCTPAVGSGTCDGYYPTAGSGGTCTNSTTSNGFAAGCATMNITYNIGRGDGNGAGGSIGDIGGVTLYGNAQYCSTLTNPSSCNAATSSNCRWFDPGGLATTPTPLATCQQATTQTACIGETITYGGGWGSVPMSVQSGGIAGCSWTPSTYMQTCHDMDGNAFGEFACTFFRPGCTWNATGSAGSAQYRPIVCRDQNGAIVADSFCPQPKPNAVQACTLNTPVNGACGSSNGHSFSAAPSTNLCTNGTASTVSGNGPWSWSCSGTNGGSTASCSASVTMSSTCTLDTTVGGGCFIANTLVAMADGSSKAIQDITVGDKLKAVDGVNTVLSLIRPTLGNQDIFSINGQKAFFTANHPFLTTDGWKSLDPETTKKEIPDLAVSQLKIGDILITENDKVLIVSITSTSSASSTQLYNFELDGDHTYFANGYAVHNKYEPGGFDGDLGDTCVQNNDCRTSVAGKPPMACDGIEKVCKYTKPSPTFMCQMDSNGNLTNWDGPGCGDWATPNYVGEGCNQILPEDGNLYTCQSNGNRSSAGTSCIEEIIDTENGYIPGNTVCTTTAPQDCICTANQYEPVCITALGG